jgi:hypothetical protein
MSYQEALTVLAKVKPGNLESLQDSLGVIRKDIENNELFPFCRLGKVHFARLQVLPESTDLNGAVIPPTLVLSTNVDAPMDEHLDELVESAGQGLDEIFGHCEGYPAENSRTRASRLLYLRSNMVKARAFYVNTVGRTLKQVREEAQLREAIEDFLDREAENRDWSKLTALDVRTAIQEYVNGDPSLSWVKDQREKPDLGWRIRQKIKKLGIPIGLVALAPAVLLGLPIYAAILRYKERTDVPEDSKPSSEHIREISAREDLFAQNPFIGVGYIKPGLLRKFTVRLALFLLNYGAEHIYNSGSLTGVKTIHFARWVIIDEGRRTLFMSNYDGSLESYMSDFIDMVAWGLNLVFSNGVGWPRTRWLVKGGADNELEFKNYLRNHQLPTQVWYTAYGNLTSLNIVNNSAIRDGLCGPLNRRQAEKWLRRL